MLLAGSLDLNALLAALARDRPVFHAEADLQHSLAWTAHTLDPRLHVRLETRPQPSLYLDVLLTRPDLGRSTALELKYLTDSWQGDHNGEMFTLKRQSAQDVRCYDVVRDITRIERLVGQRSDWNGAVLVLTNDPWYWHPRGDGPATNAEAFRIHEGTDLQGVRAWAPSTGAGTMQGREDPLELRHRHICHWRDYSQLPGNRGTLRLLALTVEHPTVQPPPGWYSDPAGSAQLRWWDGHQWTPHTSPTGWSPR